MFFFDAYKLERSNPQSTEKSFHVVPVNTLLMIALS